MRSLTLARFSNVIFLSMVCMHRITWTIKFNANLTGAAEKAEKPGAGARKHAPKRSAAAVAFKGAPVAHFPQRKALSRRRAGRWKLWFGTPENVRANWSGVLKARGSFKLAAPKRASHTLHFSSLVWKFVIATLCAVQHALLLREK